MRVDQGNMAQVKQALQAGASLKFEDRNGNAIYHAASHNHAEIAEYLLSKGACVNKQNRCDYMRTALLKAAICDNTEMVQFFSWITVPTRSSRTSLVRRSNTGLRPGINVLIAKEIQKRQMENELS